MMRGATLLLVAAMAITPPASAENLAPQTSLRPEPRPGQDGPVTALAVAPTEAKQPVQLGPEPAREKTGSGGDKSVVPLPGKRDSLRLNDADYGACLASMRGLAVVYEEVAAVVPDDDADCGILQPLKVSEIAPGITLDPPAVIRCPTALALAAWVKDFVVPAAARLQGRGALTAIENGSDYICRRRNNLADGALSEHAFGNAFDVMGFRFAQGPALIIGPGKAEDSLARAFQDAIRASACLDFATVLGPGSNASHDTHLHLDILQRPNGFRLCELQGTIQQ
jgi:hypothetical protein